MPNAEDRTPATGNRQAGNRTPKCMPVSRHPHLVFYVDREAHVDVWRVLHGERDIPSWMKTPDHA